MGLLISMLNPAIDYEVYHRLSVAIVRASGSRDVRAMSPLSVFLLGLCAKFLAASVTYPINTIKLKMQMADSKAKSGGAMGVAKRLLAIEGVAGFYPGYAFKMVNTSLKAGIKRLIMARVRESSFALILFLVSQKK